MAQKGWRLPTSVIRDPSRYSGKSLICTFHAACGWASCSTNLARSWEASQHSRQLFGVPTESSLQFRAKAAKNFARGHAEWVLASDQAAMPLPVSRWRTRAAGQVFAFHRIVFAKLCLHLKAGGNPTSTLWEHHTGSTMRSLVWAARPGTCSGSAVCLPAGSRCSLCLASPLRQAELAAASEPAGNKTSL